eukprot:gene4151-5911_t
MSDSIPLQQANKFVPDRGNYKGYYKFRSNMNDRIKLFRMEWFEGKICLDMGCNEGLVTIEIAKMMNPEYIVGIDCDKILIESADSKLKRFKYDEMLQSKDVLENQSSAPKKVLQNTLKLIPRCLTNPTKTGESSRDSTHGNHQQTDKSNVVTIKPKAEVIKKFPHNIKFVKKNLNDLTSSTKYDTILCLSVIKWVHLNEGDDGLLRFFKLLQTLIKPNGIIILEFQPWKSYQNNKNVSPAINQMFLTLQIRPDDFQFILTEEFGFILENNLGPRVEDAKGFHRPIFILRKPVATNTDKSITIDLKSILIKLTLIRDQQSNELALSENILCNNINNITQYSNDYAINNNRKKKFSRDQTATAVSLNSNFRSKKSRRDI